MFVNVSFLILQNKDKSDIYMRAQWFSTLTYKAGILSDSLVSQRNLKMKSLVGNHRASVELKPDSSSALHYTPMPFLPTQQYKVKIMDVKVLGTLCDLKASCHVLINCTRKRHATVFWREEYQHYKCFVD